MLLVDGDKGLRAALSSVLELSTFKLTSAATVCRLYGMSCSERYDSFLTGLHMPGAADALTVISAMRLANPQGATFLLNAFPQNGHCHASHPATARAK